MFNIDLYTAERMMYMRVKEALRWAKSRNLLRQARAEQQGWLSRQGHRLLRQMGRPLVALGERLKRQYGLSRSLPLQSLPPNPSKYDAAECSPSVQCDIVKLPRKQ